MHHCERKIGSSPSKRRTADLPLSGVGLLPPGAVPGMFATISSLKTTSLSCMGLLPLGAVPGMLATISSLETPSLSRSCWKIRRRFLPAMAASSARISYKPSSEAESSACPGTRVRNRSLGSFPSSLVRIYQRLRLGTLQSSVDLTGKSFVLAKIMFCTSVWTDNSSPSADIPSSIGKYLPILPARGRWAHFCCDIKYIGIGKEILLIP